MTVREVASPLQRRLLPAAPFARRGHGRSLEALLFVQITVAAVVGTLVIAIYLPIFRLGSII